MGALNSFEQELARQWPVDRWHDLRVLIAVSGGPDSVALLRAILALQPRRRNQVIVGHVDHALRDQESNRDALFVQTLVEQLGVDCYVVRAKSHEIDSDSAGTGVESSARRFRYRALAEMAENHGARHILTGHTADDQSETVLHHILRGTGLVGLSGIPRVRQVSQALSIVRPLLGFSRREILDYLSQLGQEYCVDSSNASTNFTRNRIRKTLLPLLEQDFNPAVRESLRRLAQLSSEAQETIALIVDEHLDQHVTFATDRVELDLHAIRPLTPHLQREILVALWKRMRWPLRQMDFSKWQRLVDLLSTEAGAISLPGSVVACRECEILALSRTASGIG